MDLVVHEPIPEGFAGSAPANSGTAECTAVHLREIPSV